MDFFLRGLAAVASRRAEAGQFWFISLVIGIASGFAALFFRKGIEGLQSFLYGTDNVQTLHSFAQSIPWYWILMIPALGGAIGRPNLA